jgi:hypothetical protein
VILEPRTQKVNEAQAGVAGCYAGRKGCFLGHRYLVQSFMIIAGRIFTRIN